MSFDLFDELPSLPPQSIGARSTVLRGFATDEAPALLADVERVLARAPSRSMITPGGRPMSVASSSCGDVGWVTDARGYRYASIDPLTRQPWPAMPAALRDLARQAAAAAGFPAFAPDSCLINVYEPGAKMSLHQDRDERDLTAPIVSVSLGVGATFLFGGLRRTDPTQRVMLAHGDVVVWGGEDRLRFHGILPVRDAEHPLTGRRRINLTFRQAG
ncbi:MAG: DNA oxidative demethylase AlkB [Burkholderiaceae bacterium]